MVERAGDVIPYIVKPLIELRTGNEKEIVFPKNCPSCNSCLFKEEGEAAWRCINMECSAQLIEHIIHFTSKDAMDIRGLGDAIIRKFFALNLLKNIVGIYELDFEKIEKAEGFGKKSIENLYAAIQHSKTQPLHRLIFSLGIRFVGETTAKTMSNAVQHLLDFQNFSLDDLQKLEDIGPKVAGSIYQFFNTKKNIELLQRLEELGLQLKNEKKNFVTGSNFVNQNFLFTGTLSKLKRSDAETMVENNGGKIVTSVSSKLNYLVVGDEAGSKLEKAKKIVSIKIISEEEFLQLLLNK